MTNRPGKIWATCGKVFKRGAFRLMFAPYGTMASALESVTNDPA